MEDSCSNKYVSKEVIATQAHIIGEILARVYASFPGISAYGFKYVDGPMTKENAVSIAQELPKHAQHLVSAKCHYEQRLLGRLYYLYVVINPIPLEEQNGSQEPPIILDRGWQCTPVV